MSMLLRNPLDLKRYLIFYSCKTDKKRGKKNIVISDFGQKDTAIRVISRPKISQKHGIG